METLHIEEQTFREGFDKWHIRNLPFHYAIHKISKPDFGLVHDHLTDIRTTILFGSYWERVYTVKEDGTWTSQDYHRQEGEIRDIKATTIHEILSLPEGVCYTSIQPGPIVREFCFWDFSEPVAKFREKNEKEFKYVGPI